MPLRISINACRIDGPWGGGNRFVRCVERYLRAGGHEVVRDLRPDIDLILMVVVQPELRIAAYGPEDVRRYVRLFPGTAVVLRVNTCDEQRAQDGGINRNVLEASSLADHTVFVSRFMQDLYLAQGYVAAAPHTVILTGADESIFTSDGRADWRPGQPLRLVTHHWSTNLMKGHDIYERLDDLLAQESWSRRYELTFIGHQVPGLRLANSRWLDVRDGVDLADELRRHHGLITGARNEPGGNHYIEGMRCGLPVLYLESGGTPEYCRDFGVGFTPAAFESALGKFEHDYVELRQRVLSCPLGAKRMSGEYEGLFTEVVSRKRTANLRPLPAARLRWQARQLVAARHMARDAARRLRGSWRVFRKRRPVE